MNKEEVSFLVLRQRRTHEQVAQILRRRYPTQLGLSARSVRRFCQENGISRRIKITDDQLDTAVRERIARVGHVYGRKTMHGMLASEGISVAEVRVGRSMGRVAPDAQRLRRHVARRLLNPVPYCATYFGEKLHLDQNEKLIHFGVTEVLAIDGYSRKVVGFIVTPVKNAVDIYRLLFRPLLLSQGLWNQVRTDGGREFDLMLMVQEHFGPYRLNTSKPAFRRTQSVHNLRAEQFWCHVNQRVNYPIKAVLRSLEEDGDFDLNDQIQMFCVSWVSLQLVWHGCTLLLNSWNAHRIPGRAGGVPNVLADRTTALAHPPLDEIPTALHAAQLFTNAGGHLAMPSVYGHDPLGHSAFLQEVRQRRFDQAFNPETVFSEVVAGGPRLLRQAIFQAIELSSVHVPH